jgi:hypothetical protein
MTTNFDDAFKSFFAGCEKINNDNCDRQGFSRDGFRFETGTRYVKVIRDTSVHCFVDTKNGDVLKAASWKAPAKHARGNIFDSKNGLGSMGEYGPAYLR